MVIKIPYSGQLYSSFRQDFQEDFDTVYITDWRGVEETLNENF